jgi:hypothetical protein
MMRPPNALKALALMFLTVEQKLKIGRIDRRFRKLSGK